MKLHRVLDRPSNKVMQNTKTCRGRGTRGFSRTSVCKEVTKDLSKRLTWKNIARGILQTRWGNNDIYVYMSRNSYRDIKNQYKTHTYWNSYIINDMVHMSIKQQFIHTISCLFHFHYLLQLCILDHCLEDSFGWPWYTHRSVAPRPVSNHNPKVH